MCTHKKDVERLSCGFESIMILSVNLFVYLLNRYLSNGETSFVVTHKELKNRIGLAISTTSNNIVINDILDILRRLGLITYEL